MYIDRFGYEKEKLVDEISICIGESKPARHQVLYSTPDFPLVDLLYQLYKAAVVGSVALPENCILSLVEQYRNEVDDSFNYSFENLVEFGWIETCFGNYKIIGHRKSGIDEIFRNESMRCDDWDILQFIFWTDELQKDNNSIFLKRDEVEDLIAKWQKVSDKVQDLNWFCELNILSDQGDRIVISSGTKYQDCITQAMGRLWNDICEGDNYETDSLKWFRLAAQTRINLSVFEIINDEEDRENRKKLLSLIMSAIRTDNRYVSEETEYRKIINTFRFNGTYNLSVIQEHKDLYTIREHRSLRKGLGHIFEDARLWQDFQMWCDSFYLGAVIRCMRSLDTNDFKDVFGLLKTYADSGRLQRSFVNIQPDKHLEILLHKETFYYGGIKLVESIKPYDNESAGIVDKMSNLLERVLELYQKSVNQPASEDMFDFLLYVVNFCKILSVSGPDGNQYNCLYNKMTKIYFKSDLIKRLITDAPEYFNKLMINDHVEVDFGKCFYFLCRFTYCVILSEGREESVVDALCEEVYHGLCKILTEKGSWSHFIDSVCFSEELSERVYANHILRLSDNKKRKVLGFDFETDEKTDIIYRHKAAIVFLTKAGYSIEDAMLILQNYLQISMIERKTLDYNYVSIFNMEELMREAFGLLERHNETFKPFFISLLRLNLPELILCTGLLNVEEEIAACVEEIEERVKDTEDIDELFLHFNEEKLIDIVLDKKIECLYSFVKKRLDWKLEKYRSKGAINGNQYYQVADSQRKKLIYIKGDIEEIKRCNDPFLIAAFKTDNIKRISDYIEVIEAWRLILNNRDREKNSFSACYNYLYAIYSVVQKSEGDEFPIPIGSESAKTFDTDLQWVIDYSISGEMNRWITEQQELYLDLLIRTGVKLGRDAEKIFVYVKEHTRLKIDEGRAITMVSDVVKEQARKPDTYIGVMMKYEGNKDDEDVIAALQKYSARSLVEKTKLLAKCKAKYEDGKDWYGAFELKTVIAACMTLRKTVPYFVMCDKSCKQGIDRNIQIPPEDYISILFRECYNMAFRELFGVYVSDQSKLSTTGYLLKNKNLPSPAEADMVIYYDMSDVELFEAFILKNSTKTAVYKDHMGKVMGNNTNLHSPVFMLVYTFEDRVKNKRKWGKYRDYLEKEFEQDYEDLENGNGIKSRLADIEESGCFIHGFSGELNGLDFIRQVVTIDERDVEIIHILIDMSISIPSAIRKSARS